MIKYFSVFIIAVFFLKQDLLAKTLQHLARVSNAILVINDNPQYNICKLTTESISEKSQNLKAEVDEKIRNLKANDFKILKQRLHSCDLDCTCDVYSLALEQRARDGEISSVLQTQYQKKSESITQDQRIKCFNKNKIFCNDF
ncbi:MAG: hypothetical protein ACK41T_12550 [Pseudobdellovibrio sp.]